MLKGEDHLLLIPGNKKVSCFCSVIFKKCRGSISPGFKVMVSVDPVPGSRIWRSSGSLLLRMKRGAKVTTLVNLYFPSPSSTEIPICISLVFEDDGRTTSVTLPTASKLWGLLQPEPPTLRTALFCRSSLGYENIYGTAFWECPEPTNVSDEYHMFITGVLTCLHLSRGSPRLL